MTGNSLSGDPQIAKSNRMFGAALSRRINNPCLHNVFLSGAKFKLGVVAGCCTHATPNLSKDGVHSSDTSREGSSTNTFVVCDYNLII